MRIKSNLIISIYKSENFNEWNSFVHEAKNSHFMFNRNYMDYHSNKFIDCSLLIRNNKEELLAILPANISNKTLYSHQGLSFGALCLKKNATTHQVIDIFKSLISFFKNDLGIDKFVYKRIPDFYASYPSQEDLYSLFLFNFNLFRRDITSAIDFDNPLPKSELRIRGFKKAKKNNLYVEEISSFNEFWISLTELLKTRHNTKPVHSLNEIELLHKRFPKNIKCIVAKKDNKIIAGTILFIQGNVVHTQYLMNSPIGKNLGGLDIVIFYLIEKYSKVMKYLDFGISNEYLGKKLNSGLILQKEGFGGRAFTHDFYCLNLIKSTIKNKFNNIGN